MALIFVESLVSPAVTATAFSRRTALSFTQLHQMPTAHAAGIAAKIAMLRAEHNHASRRRPTSFISYSSARAAGLSVRFEAPRNPRSDKTVCGRRRNVDAKLGKKYIDFYLSTKPPDSRSSEPLSSSRPPHPGAHRVGALVPNILYKSQIAEIQMLFQNPAWWITICLATRIDCFPVDPFSTKCGGISITQ